MNDHDRRDLPLALSLVTKVPGLRFHGPSAADARTRIVSFFDHHLRA